MSAGRSAGSTFSSARSPVRMYSAKPPSADRPGLYARSQCASSPRRHGRQSPHVTNECAMTVSPTATDVTADPISWTHPAFSCPTMNGSPGDVKSHIPSRTCRSVRHTPAPPMRTMTSSGLWIVGSGTWSRWSLWSS